MAFVLYGGIVPITLTYIIFKIAYRLYYFGIFLSFVYFIFFFFFFLTLVIIILFRNYCF